MSDYVTLASDEVPQSTPTNGGRRRLPSFFEDQEPHAIQATSPYSMYLEDRPLQGLKKDSGVEDRHASLLPEPAPGGDAKPIYPYSESRITDSGFSRHDSLFSFGVPAARNAAELKSLLGNSSARLRPGATVLPRHARTMDKSAQPAHAVSLERAKSRARVEVDIVLESDCCIAGGYLRGHVELRVRKRQKKEAPVLLADGRVRVIGFECIPSTRDYHTFYQRASALSAITDAYARIYDSPPDAEGFSRAIEGVHVLPFAMHLSDDDMLGTAKGAVNIQPLAALRYIAMVSVKIKDSKSLKRSIAHFYRDCEVWPRLNLNVMLANPPRPIQASSAKSFSMIGGGGQLKLTAMLHRSTWMAGQRCYVRVGLGNNTKKTVKTVVLTLIRSITLFKHRSVVDSGNFQSPEEGACQTTATHKVVAESYLEKSHPASKHHASTDGWWTGVRAGEDVCFAHHVLIPSDALSVPRSRLVEVEYSIRVTASAGALTPDVHVALPLRIINFLSGDPTPSGPLLSSDGSYARLVPFDHSLSGTPTAQSDTDDTIQYTFSEVSTISINPLSTPPDILPLSDHYPSPPAQATPRSPGLFDPIPGDIPVPETLPAPVDPQGYGPNTISAPQTSPTAVPPTSESGSSMYSTDSLTSSSPIAPATFDNGYVRTPSAALGNLDLHDGANSDEEIANIIYAAQDDPLSAARVYSGITDAYPRSPHGHGRTKNSGSPQTPGRTPPLQFTQLPRSRPPAATFATSPPMMVRSGAPVYRDPSPSLLEEPTESLACQNPDHRGINREESITPRLRPSTALQSGISAPKPWPSDASPPIGVLNMPHSGSPRRRPPSRRLPQPPSQPEPMSDVPASISARDALRLSRFKSARTINPGSRSTTNSSGLSAPAVHSNDSKRYPPAIVQRSPPVSRIRPVPSSSTATPGNNGSSLSSPRIPHEQPGTVSSSTSSATLKARPSGRPHALGRSDSSVVRGRIVAYEERMRYSVDSSAG